MFGVVRNNPKPPSLDHLKAVIDAAFPQINSQVAQAYAGSEDKRELLRQTQTVAFVVGIGTLPNNVLKAFLDDAVLTITVAIGQPAQKYAYKQWPDYLRGGDNRLGYWSTQGDAIDVTRPASAGTTLYTGNGDFSAICSPDIPMLESDEYVTPADFVPDLIDAFISWILSQSTISQAAAAAESQ